MRRVAVIASASGSGKTSVGRSLAARLDVPFVELDALNHGIGWAEASYRGKLDDVVLEAADTVVWLDLPRRVWLPRLLRRTIVRIVEREESGRETARPSGVPSGGGTR
jgi:adenylate kinase family enzyme